MSIIFEWDIEKDKINFSKHGIRFEEAKSVFYDHNAILIADIKHSEVEERFILIGYSHNNRLLFVSYTERTNSIRVISSRKATTKERVYYENNNKNN